MPAIGAIDICANETGPANGERVGTEPEGDAKRKAGGGKHSVSSVADDNAATTGTRVTPVKPKRTWTDPSGNRNYVGKEEVAIGSAIGRQLRHELVKGPCARQAGNGHRRRGVSGQPEEHCLETRRNDKPDI